MANATRVRHVKLVPDSKDIEISNGGIIAGSGEVTVVFHHSGKKGREETPYTKIHVLLDEDDKVELFSFDLYVFDLYEAKIQPLILFNGSVDLSQNVWPVWRESIPFLNTVWSQQAVILYSVLEPVSINENIPIIHGKDMAFLRTSYAKLYPGKTLAFISSLIFDPIKDKLVLGAGTLGFPSLYLGEHDGIRSSVAFAHEVGHNNGLEHEPHVKGELMWIQTESPIDAHLTLQDVKTARLIALRHWLRP